MKKLAVICTHPIQYYAPVFKLIQERRQLELKVYYTWGAAGLNKFDQGFGKNIQWDLPLLDGYPYEFARNTAKEPGSHHFRGIVNPDLIERIHAWQPDALLIYGWAFQSHLQIMRHFKNKLPIYFRGDSTLLNEPTGLRKLLKKLCLSWVYKHIDQAFYVGRNNKAYFKRYGLRENQLNFAPHAVDNNRFSTPHSKAAALFRAKANITEQDILMLYAGKFEAVKNILLLIKAFTALNQPNTQLLLAGNGSEEEMLKAAARHSDSAARIHFIEFQNQSDMPAMYQACDLLCLPSNSETWGLSVNEAMACGKSVLVSDRVGCAVDLVIENHNGGIFLARSLQSLTQQLAKMTSGGRAGLAEMGRHSRQIIAQWSFQQQASAIETTIINHGS